QGVPLGCIQCHAAQTATDNARRLMVGLATISARRVAMSVAVMGRPRYWRTSTPRHRSQSRHRTQVPVAATRSAGGATPAPHRGPPDHPRRSAAAVDAPRVSPRPSHSWATSENVPARAVFAPAKSPASRKRLSFTSYDSCDVPDYVKWIRKDSAHRHFEPATLHIT